MNKHMAENGCFNTTISQPLKIITSLIYSKQVKEI